MKTRLQLLIALAVAISSCGRGTDGPVPVFDIMQRSYPEKELILQDIATVEYIPLETKVDFLLGAHPNIQYMDDEIIVTNTKTNIILFDRKSGKAINSFSREGRGPGEYLGVGTVAVDKKAGEIFVLENVIHSDRNSPMYVYDLQGKHLRTLELPGMGFRNYFHVYDDDYLFFYNEQDTEKTEQEPAPYRLISRTDNTHTHLPVEFQNRDHMDVRVEMENGYYVVHRGGTAVLKTPEGYIFSEPGVDTIYSWNRRSGELTPVMARTPTFHSTTVPVALWVEAQSSDYLFLGIDERKENKPGERRNYDFSGLYYDKTDGEFYEGGITNSDYVEGMPVRIPNVSSSQVAYPNGELVEVIQAVRLVDLYEKGKLQGALAEVASRLKEEDNPVLMIFTFK